jgi:hypothetical protein
LISMKEHPLFTQVLQTLKKGHPQSTQVVQTQKEWESTIYPNKTYSQRRDIHVCSRENTFSRKSNILTCFTQCTYSQGRQILRHWQCQESHTEARVRPGRHHTACGLPPAQTERYLPVNNNNNITVYTACGLHPVQTE